MAVYLHTPKAKASNVASFALPNESFVRLLFKTYPLSDLWLSSLLTDS